MTFNLTYKNLFQYLINAGICKEEDLDHIKVDIGSSKNFSSVIDLPQNKGKLVVKHKPHYSTLPIDDRIHKEWHIYNYFQLNQYLVYASSLMPNDLHFD